MIKSILTVCIGNICRSPMAAALIQSHLSDCHVFSAGVDALVGYPAAKHAQYLLSARGLSLQEHRAAQLIDAHCRAADLILVMDNTQKQIVDARYPFARGKVFRLGNFGKYDIPDPYQKSLDHFRKSLELIENGVLGWIEPIRKSS